MWFFIASLATRFFAGLGDALVQTSCKNHFKIYSVAYSVITLQFPENSDKYLGWAEAATGVGLMMGPALGSLTYQNLGYFYTFIAFGGFLLLGALILFLVLPSELNSPAEINISIN